MNSPLERLFEELEKAPAFGRRLDRAIKGLEVGAWAERDLLTLVGAGSTPAKLTMANMRALKAAAALLCSAVEEAYSELATPATAFYKLTLFHDVGIMPQGTPQLEVPALQAAVERAMNALGLCGFGYPRLQPVDGITFESGDDPLLLYGQAFCWSTGGEEDIWEKVEALNLSLANELAIDVEAISIERVPPSVVSVLCVPATLAGMPDYLWYFEEEFDGFGRFYETEMYFKNDQALRIAEGFSHVLIRDAVFGIGDGILLVEAWQDKLESWHREQMDLDGWNGNEAVEIDVVELWSAVRSWGPNYFQTPFTLA